MTTIGQLITDGYLVMSDGYRTKRSELGHSGYRIIRVADVRDGSISFTNPDYVSIEHERVIGGKAGREGDILLTTKGTVGRFAVVPRLDQPVVYSPQVCFFRVSEDSPVDGGYLRYWLGSAEFSRQALDRMNNTDMAPYINLADIRSLKLNFPSVDHQQAIAKVLGALDDKIAINNRTSINAQQLAVKIFEGAVDRARTEGRRFYPTTIENLVNTGHLIMSDGYRTNRSELGDTGYRIIRISDIVGGTILPTGSDRVSEGFRQAIGGKAGHAGDIVLTTKGTVGRVASVTHIHEPIVYSPQICFFRVIENPTLERWYLRYWLDSREFVRQSEYCMHNTDMAPYISLADMRSLQLELPSLVQQKTITERPRALEERVHACSRENLALAALRDALLPQLISGKLRVRDAEKRVEEVV